MHATLSSRCVVLVSLLCATFLLFLATPTQAANWGGVLDAVQVCQAKAASGCTCWVNQPQPRQYQVVERCSSRGWNGTKSYETGYLFPSAHFGGSTCSTSVYACDATQNAVPLSSGMTYYGGGTAYTGSDPWPCIVGSSWNYGDATQWTRTLDCLGSSQYSQWSAFTSLRGTASYCPIGAGVYSNVNCTPMDVVKATEIGRAHV
jgi:hypothetical protein